ncbi:glycosyltransferase family 2 protein [Ascidiimonas sp. W6]|uniref:glycosyltransferase family 2 protein n=1 Tax=Ascidiimonas meishanensis TaxID=3128903 RepID=UPI0030EBDFD5
MENILTIAAFVICFAYGLLIIGFIIGSFKLRSDALEASETLPEICFSIIVPFRNEIENIPILINSLIKLNYKHQWYELLFVDDASKDGSANLIHSLLDKYPQLDYKILNNHRKTSSPKKDAITTAITTAKYEWIVTTDADCRVPSRWLESYNKSIQKNDPVFIAGPVTYCIRNRFLEQFELLDFLSLMGSTMGGFGIGYPFLCNGANLAYKKKVFFALNGFLNNAHIAGGDDIFTLEKVKKAYPEKLVFLKHTDAIVTTLPQGNLRELLAQRIRWAAKASAYKNNFAILVGSIVFVMNLFLIVLVFLSASKTINFNLLIWVYLLKFNLDFLLLYQSAKFFKQENEMKAYFLSSVLYPFFNVLVAFRSFFGGYRWKGRYFRK